VICRDMAADTALFCWYRLCMPAITLAEAEAQLAAWLTASKACADGKEYRMPNGKMVKHEDGSEVRKQIADWNRIIVRMNAGGGIRIRGAMPIG